MYSDGIQFGDDGGTGFGALTDIEGSGGGIFAESGGREIDGRSFGIFSGSGSKAAGRTLDDSFATGTYSVEARFDVDNSTAFSGFNLKSAIGTSFGGNELLSIGLTPGTGNNAVFVGANSDTSIDLGSDVRGAILDLEVDFDASAGTYTAKAKFDGDTTFSTVSGDLNSSGTSVDALGWGNFNSGDTQNLISDNVNVVPEPGAYALAAGAACLVFAMVRRRMRG